MARTLPFLQPVREPVADPIRAEIFGVERLEQHAESLARAQTVSTGAGRGRPLLQRVEDNARVLRDAHGKIADAIREERWITPAAEWLVDNFHVADEQLREIRDDLPAAFYRELPKIEDGPLAGYPRVYGIAWAFVAHTDSRFEPEALRRFVQAYQRVQALTIGELWAIAITLRVVLVENLRRCAEAIVRARESRSEADLLADDLLGLGARPAVSTATALQRWENEPLAAAFAVELVQRLRDRDPAVTPALLWLRERLAAQGTTPDEVVALDHQRQAAMTVTVRNVITSMRAMSAFDWEDFFESVSLVDAELRTHDNFMEMDFHSRDRYRHAVEQMARGSTLPELEIAREALRRARAAKDAAANGTAPPDERREDPGYYLIGSGRLAFERELGVVAPLGRRLIRSYIASATPAYLGSIALLTLLIVALPLLASGGGGAATNGLILLGFLALIPASDLAIALVNRSIASAFTPALLPRLELRGGVPASLRTMVAIPTLLGSADDVEEHVERIEVHYLANPDGDVYFAILSDWPDATSEHVTGDDETLAAARDGISRLNRRHGPMPDGSERFHLFHRRRLWNKGERRWMGWERKRGKLHELNRLLRGATDTTFLPTDGVPAAAPDGVRYVLTLDSDTRLSIGGVTQLVGTIAHPLNCARFDPVARRVVEGYAILQPRVTPPLPGRAGSLYQHLASGPSGVDPYAAAVSDVYQDLFGEGSYTGKGIYDVDAFEASLEGRVPENALLSHDLYEGLYARTALVTDIELFESAPSNYVAACSRQHRWARGDWQLLPWIRRARVPLIGRWKMFDNLRRSLSPPAAFLTLAIAWTWPGASPVIWNRFILAIITLPALLPVAWGIVPRARGISKRSHGRAVGRDVRLALWQVSFMVTTLANQAWLMLDAIVRTLLRVFVTHRHLLAWVTAAQTKSRMPRTILEYYGRMAGGLILVVLAAAAVIWKRPESLPSAIALLMLWSVAPAAARWISIPRMAARTSTLDAVDARSLRLIARRTWRYFTTFVGAEDRWLPPDNFQESPTPVVAHRTSPTNIGLYLMSVVTARDFGWLGVLDMVDRIEATLESIKSLEHLHGHLYNWYDTRDGRPLDPKYVSAVDSGNLAGALIALGSACREIAQRPLLRPETLPGIADSAWLLRASAHLPHNDQVARSPLGQRLDSELDRLDAALVEVPRSPAEWATRLDALNASTLDVAALVRDVVGIVGEGAAPELGIWATTLRTDIASAVRDLDTIMPWARLAHASAETVMERLARCPSLEELPAWCASATRDLVAIRAGIATDGGPESAASNGIAELVSAIEHSAAAADALLGRLSAIVLESEKMMRAMEFAFLFDQKRKLFSIGYRVTEGALDPGWYDLLASEARLMSFIAIAKGDVPVSSWFHLGRPLTPAGRDSVLMSWSGSMFEYLMPALLMRTPVGSLLEQTCRLVVARQITYGEERGMPWGVSESGYNARDVEMTYQYSNFGVPGLGLRRGLGDEIVVAPYATALAAMIDPVAAVQNFRQLEALGANGAFGFHEAIDFTASRLPAETPFAVVHSYMAHHQGMLLVAIANALDDGVMRARFHAEPMVQASELLLQERTPRDVAVARPSSDEFAAVGDVREMVAPLARRYNTPHGSLPRPHLLSNGRYAVMVTSAGSGYSRWHDIAVTRWREDATCDDRGSYIYVRDAESGESWSAGFQPRGGEPDSYHVAFLEDRAEISRRDGAIATKLEILVSSEDDAEVRRITLTNLGSRTREIDVTSYAEVVLAPQAADVAHPAFLNLFVSTECVPEVETLLATRRRRSPEEAELWLAHVLAVEGDTVGPLQWETDRVRFLGRGHTLRTAVSGVDGHDLSNTVGAVLDPVISLRRRVRLPAGRTAQLCFATIVGPTRQDVLNLADKYHDVTTFERAATLAWTQAQVQLHHLGIGPDEAQLFQGLAGAILFADRTLRASPEVHARQAGGAPMLWVNGISGDIPIVVVQIDDPEDVGIVRQLLRAHKYWRLKRLAVDLVILNDRAPSYMQDLQTLLQTLVRTSQSSVLQDDAEARGKVFVLRADQLTPAQRDVLLSAARAVLSSRRGTLAEQVARGQRSDVAPVVPARRAAPAKPATGEPRPTPDLEFFNGSGGFDAEGTEYVTILGPGESTPAPWANVIANADFGFVATETGGGFTWSQNSQEHQLTPWANDAASDPPGEALYVRDEDAGTIWCPTALPIREPSGEYVTRHGQGYTRYTRDSNGIALDLLQFVALEDPIKVSRLTLTNHSGRVRRLSVTAYVEWVLGTSRSASAPFVITELDAATGALFARNSWSTDAATRIAFADLGGAQSSFTADRTEFLGRNGTTAYPAALDRRERLSGRVGAALDPCGALQGLIEIPDGGAREVVFLLGDAPSREDARALIVRYRANDLDASLTAVTDHWESVLGAIQVQTPDRALDVMMNRWLLYQTLSCRILARSGLYQTSGAYGFRDQLQDVLALTVTRPDITREHLLRAAGRQFVEGDVQHWWHPPAGRGIRTRFSDDLLWLPYVASRYLEVTGDTSVLDEFVPFLDGPLLAAGQSASYFQPSPSQRGAALFEHGARSIDKSLAVGSHGLPLMGAGDWNDGMNHVGAGGKGESVWLGWFLFQILGDWARLADLRGDSVRATTWRTHAASLKDALERDGWDGEWYRRAYFDDGTPLGSSTNEECRIDSIAQTWSVMSRGGELNRQRRAMTAVDDQLVRRGENIVLLLTPPFDKSAVEPGYIKGYLPGIRENGAQYTHAATWAVVAFAMLGDGNRAAELFHMMNPIGHASTSEGVARYRVEPYVVAADVYSEPPHVGRGGWTWYTGSSGWMYRAGLESILGFQLRGKRLTIDPCIPRAWPGFTMSFRYHSTRYEIVVENPKGVSRGVTLLSHDDVRVDVVNLVDDGRSHRIHVVLG